MTTADSFLWSIEKITKKFGGVFMHGHHRAINIILSSNVQKYQKKHNLSLIPREPENWSIIVISKRVFNSRILWELHSMFISFKESDCKKNKRVSNCQKKMWLHLKLKPWKRNPIKNIWCWYKKVSHRRDTKTRISLCKKCNVWNYVQWSWSETNTDTMQSSA